jgi:hypothetical protein
MAAMDGAQLPPRSATEWEVLNDRPLAESEFIEQDVREARAAWLPILKRSESMPAHEREQYLASERSRHFSKFPRLLGLQELVNRPHNSDVNAIIALMSVLPYAAYNLRQYAIERGVSFIQLFDDQLTPEKISLLNRATRTQERISEDLFSGECFAKKRRAHGLVSESDRYLWVAQEQSPLVQLYTIGHELIHAAQIQSVMASEQVAISKGQLSLAWFMNHYGNFLSLASNTFDDHHADQSRKRKPVYGLADRMVSQFDSPVIQDIRKGLAKGGGYYEQQLDRYGSLLGYRG